MNIINITIKNKTIGESSFIYYPVSEITEKLNFLIQMKITKGNFISISEKKYALFNRASQE